MRYIQHYCPVCANVLAGYSEEELLQISEMKCCYCGNQIISTDKEAIDLAEYRKEHRLTSDDAVREIYVYNNPLFDKTKSDKRVAAEDAEKVERDQRHRYLELYKANNGTPKCPICQSTSLSKISTASKVGKIAMFGIFGMGDNGKTWKCNSCGSRF